MLKYDVIILGAGASGLMCAMTAGRRGRRVLVLDHAGRPGRKILVAGGGKCNFTNLDVSAKNYFSRNPHFVKSALSRYTQWDTISFLAEHGIAYEERDHGRLFCERSAADVVKALLDECRKAGIEFLFEAQIQNVRKAGGGFSVQTSGEALEAGSVVVALGGPAWPQVGATGFGHELARRFGLDVVAPRPGLAPLDMGKRWKFGELTGISLRAVASCGGLSFEDDLLFTHHGLSGPAALQVSSLLEAGTKVTFDLLPGQDFASRLEDAEVRRLKLKNLLSRFFPARLASMLVPEAVGGKTVANLSKVEKQRVAEAVHAWTVVPSGTEGFRKAEVTCGGVDTDGISSKTMESKTVPGLYFVGEVLDVTGWLGGYNLQWAWSSGFAAGSFC